MRGLPDIGDDFGPYRIEGTLGRGAMGTVYTATQRRLGRTEALKVLSPSWIDADDYRDRFVREAETLARLDSPHIIHIYDYGDVDGTPYISTQLVRGGDLSQLIRDRGPLPRRMALTIAAQVASALEDAHGSLVIHRDVKPSNVLLRHEAEPFAYLCDFGIARSESAGLTTTGTVVGTWAYLAPERCNGGEASVASDVYSVGCLLWAMLTGEPPYRGSDVSVAMAHIHEPVPQLPGDDNSTRQLNLLLSRTLAKSPDQRFGTAGQLRAALVELASERSLPPPPAAVPGPHAAPSRRVSEDTQIRRLTPPLPVPPPSQRAGRSRMGLIALVALAVILVAAAGVGAVLWGQQLGGNDAGSGDTAGSAAPSTAARGAGKRLQKLTRVSYDGRKRSQVAIQSFAPSGNGAVQLFRLAPDGSVTSSDPGPLPTEPPIIHRMNGDFDGDFKTDAAIFADTQDGQVVSVARSGAAGFGSPTRWGEVPGLTNDGFGTVTGDFDGNGKMDIAIIEGEGTSTTPNALRLEVMLSDGSRFAAPEPWSAPLPWRMDAAKFEPGDVNGDGRTDLVALHALPDGSGIQVMAMLATKRGRFASPTVWLEVGAGLPSTVGDIKAMVGDFDGDRLADLMVDEPTQTKELPGVQMVFMRSTGSKFESGRRWFRALDWRLDDAWLSVGDFNADGVSDVGCVLAAGHDVDVRFLLSRRSSLQLQEEHGRWLDHSKNATRTLNVLG